MTGGRAAVNLRGPHFCYYCGSPTSMPAYVYGGLLWPACCAGESCVERWKPLLRAEPEAVLEGAEAEDT